MSATSRSMCRAEWGGGSPRLVVLREDCEGYAVPGCPVPEGALGPGFRTLFGTFPTPWDLPCRTGISGGRAGHEAGGNDRIDPWGTAPAAPEHGGAAVTAVLRCLRFDAAGFARQSAAGGSVAAVDIPGHPVPNDLDRGRAHRRSVVGAPVRALGRHRRIPQFCADAASGRVGPAFGWAARRRPREGGPWPGSASPWSTTA